jgi:predicted Zn-dependent protease
MSSDYSSTGPGLRLVPLAVGVIAIAFFLIRGCQEGPFGRRQVVALNPQQEAQLGAQAFRQVLDESESELVRSGPVVDAVRRVGKRLAEASKNPEFLRLAGLKEQPFQWEFAVVRSPQINAFCLPGGKVVVYTGILPVAETEAGLATVMGHEIGHALAHHGAERMAQQQMVAIGQMALASSMDRLDPAHRAQLLGLLGAGSQVGILLPFSRSHESEADHIGLLLMAAAGYDPNEAAVFWQRMEKSARGGTPEFLSTHPSHQRRERDLRAWVNEALPLYRASTRQKGDTPLPRLGRGE